MQAFAFLAQSSCYVVNPHHCIGSHAVTVRSPHGKHDQHCGSKGTSCRWPSCWSCWRAVGILAARSSRDCKAIRGMSQLPAASRFGCMSCQLQVDLANTSMHSYQARKSLTDYGNLPCPVKYEELQREALSMSLNRIISLQTQLLQLQIGNHQINQMFVFGCEQHGLTCACYCSVSEARLV